MKGSHHCFSVWLKIMTISTLCKVYLAFGLFFIFILFLVLIVYCLILPCLFCDNYTNDAVHAPFIDLLCEHLSGEWCTQMLTVIVSLLFGNYNFLCGIRSVCFIIAYTWLVFFNAQNQILLAGEHHLLGETLSCLRYSY
jgi:hypothetical protein